MGITFLPELWETGSCGGLEKKAEMADDQEEGREGDGIRERKRKAGKWKVKGRMGGEGKEREG